MKKQIGIWLDFKETYFIERMGEDFDIRRLPSPIEPQHISGGSRSRTPWGPMDKVSESRVLERRKHAEKIYFHTIIDSVKDADELYIFGPAEAKDGLMKEIRSIHHFKPAILAVVAADRLTKNQMIAQTRKFFEEREFV